MNDLDKLMKKLKEDDPVEETPKVEETPVLDEENDDEDVEEIVKTAIAQNDVKAPVQEVETPKQAVTTHETDGTPVEHVNHDHTIEAEVGMLQNDGIFRRELLLVKKEQVDVLKVIAQLLIDLTKNGSKKAN